MNKDLNREGQICKLWYKYDNRVGTPFCEILKRIYESIQKKKKNSSFLITPNSVKDIFSFLCNDMSSSCHFSIKLNLS